MTEAEWLITNVPRAMLQALIHPLSLTRYLRGLKPEDQERARQLDRKVRLFACGCVRQVWHLLEDERSREAVELSERYAEGMASPQEMKAARLDSEAAASHFWNAGRLSDAGASESEAAEDYDRRDLPAFDESPEGRAWNAATAASWLTHHKIGVEGPAMVFETAWAAADVASLWSARADAEAAELRTQPAFHAPWTNYESSDRSRFFHESLKQSDLFRCIFGNPFRPVEFDPSWLTSEAVALARAIETDRSFNHMIYLADALEEAGCCEEAVIAHCREPGEHPRGCWVLDSMRGIGWRM